MSGGDSFIFRPWTSGDLNIYTIIFLLVDWYFLNWAICKFLWFMIKLSFWLSLGWWLGFSFPHFSDFY